MELEKTTIEREVTTTVSEDVFVLTLTREEACALTALTGSVSGWRQKDNLREFTDPIYDALHESGVEFDSEEVNRFVKNLSGSPIVKSDD